MAIKAGLALGSNLGDRLANICKARDLLRALSPADVRFDQAPLYQSSPVACQPDAPDFYNTVVEIDFIGTPHDLLQATQGIEFLLGRKSVAERNAPRVIDIDILYFGDTVVRGDILTIPHPGLTHRRFVLQPLADIRPDLILPRDTATIAEHLQHLDSGEPPLTLVQTHW